MPATVLDRFTHLAKRQRVAQGLASAADADNADSRGYNYPVCVDVDPLEVIELEPRRRVFSIQRDTDGVRLPRDVFARLPRNTQRHCPKIGRNHSHNGDRFCRRLENRYYTPREDAEAGWEE